MNFRIIKLILMSFIESIFFDGFKLPGQDQEESHPRRAVSGRQQDKDSFGFHLLCIVPTHQNQQIVKFSSGHPFKHRSRLFKDGDRWVRVQHERNCSAVRWTQDSHTEKANNQVINNKSNKNKFRKE